jgi:hypothetical protein
MSPVPKAKPVARVHSFSMVPRALGDPIVPTPGMVVAELLFIDDQRVVEFDHVGVIVAEFVSRSVATDYDVAPRLRRSGEVLTTSS